MTSIMVLIDSENGCGFWSASVASMMRRSMSLTSGSLADGMEKWSSMQMSPVWKTVASPEENRTLAAPRMWPLSVRVTLAPPTSSGLPKGTGTSRLRTSWIGAPPGSPPPIAVWSLSALTMSFAEVEQVATAAHLSSPSQSAEGQRRPRPGVAAYPGERGASRRPIRPSLPARWRRVLVVGVFLRGPAARFSAGAQVAVRLEHLAHELHKAGGLRGAFERSGQGCDLVLYRTHQELTEASIGKAGVLQGVLYSVTLFDHAPELLVQLLDTLGRPGVGRALPIERLLELGVALFEVLDAFVELTPHIQGRGRPLLRLPDQLRGVRAFTGEDLDLFGEGGGPLFSGPGCEREPLVVLLQTLQLGFEIPDPRVLGGPFLGLALLFPPGVDERLDYALFWLLIRAQGGQQQALGGVGLLELFQVLRGEIFQGLEGLGWDLLLDGGAERAPGGRVVGEPARDAPEEGRP